VGHTHGGSNPLARTIDFEGFTVLKKELLWTMVRKITLTGDAIKEFKAHPEKQGKK
jgi:hypothetical protein